jgi:CRP-like cAMP-binding protein
MSDLLEYCADLPVVTVEPGDCVVHQGRMAEAVYVLIEGEVQMERDGIAFATVTYPGAVFGEMSTVLQRPATASARVMTRSRMHVAHDPLTMLRDRPEVTLAVLRLTAGRLDAMTHYLADVRTQYAGSAGHLGLVDGVLESLLHYQAPDKRPGSARDPLG